MHLDWGRRARCTAPKFRQSLAATRREMIQGEWAPIGLESDWGCGPPEWLNP